MDEAPAMEAKGDDHAKIMALVEMYRAATHQAIDDPVEAMMLGMTAAIFFAGTEYGSAVAIGMESGKRPRIRRILQMMERNFKSGIDISLRHASRIAGETGARQ